MPRHLWSVACQNVLTDRETNTVSYLVCAEGFALRKEGSPFPPVFSGSLWLRSSPEDELLVRVKVLSPSGEVAQQTDFGPRPFGKPSRWRVNVRVGGFPVTEAGTWHLVTELHEHDDWIECARLPIDIEFANVDTSRTDDAPSRPSVPKESPAAKRPRKRARAAK